MARLILALLALVLLIPIGWVQAGQIVKTTLPITLTNSDHSAAYQAGTHTRDTITYAGASFTTPGDLITNSAASDSFDIILTGQTFQWGTSGNNNDAVMLGGLTAARNIRIFGGVLHHNPDDTSTYGNNAVSLGPRAHKITMHGVDMSVRGYSWQQNHQAGDVPDDLLWFDGDDECHGIRITVPISTSYGYGHQFISCILRDSVTSWVDRCQQVASAVKIDGSTGVTPGIKAQGDYPGYMVWFDSCIIDPSPHIVFACYYSDVRITNGWYNLDARSDTLDILFGDTLCSTNCTCVGVGNAYFMNNQRHFGGEFINNVCTTKAQFHGCRGTMTGYPQDEDTLFMDSNTFHLSEGRDHHYGETLPMHGLRWRYDATGGATFNNNIMHTYADTLAATKGIGSVVIAIRVSNDIDSSLIRGNRIYSHCLSGGVTMQGFSVYMSNITESQDFMGFEVANNYWEWDGVVYALGGDFPGDLYNLTIFGDTLVMGADQDSCVASGAIWLGSGDNGPIENVTLRDIMFSGGWDETDVTDGGGATATHELTFERTLVITTIDATEQPVFGATSLVINAYGDTVLSGTTDVNGEITGPVVYRYLNDVSGDSLAYNNFTIWTKLGTDSTSAILTVGGTAAGGTDTLTLSETGGGGPVTPIYHMELTGLSGTDGLGLPREQFITLSDGSIVMWRSSNPELYRSYDTGQTWSESINLAAISGHNHAHLAVRNDTIFIGQRGPTDGLYLAVVDASVTPMTVLMDNTAQYPGVTCNYGALTTGGFYPLPGSSRFLGLYRGADCSFTSVNHTSVANYTDTATATIVDASAVTDGLTRIGSITYGGDLYAICYYVDTAMYLYLYDSTSNTWSADGANAYGVGNTKVYSRFFDVNYWGDRWVMLVPSADQDTVFYTSKQVGAATWDAVQVLATGNDGNESCDISLQRNEATGRLTAVWTYGNASSLMSMWTAYLDPNAASVDDWSTPEIMVDGDSVTFRTYKYASPNIVHAAHGDVAYLTYSDNTSNTQRLLWIEYAEGSQGPPAASAHYKRLMQMQILQSMR